jgi:hypothetical protein
LIATTVRAQDHLGALNDAQVAGGLVHAFLMAWQAESAHDAFRPGAGIAAYLAYQHQRLAELTAGVPAVWDDLTAPEFRNGLGAVVASL